MSKNKEIKNEKDTVSMGFFDKMFGKKQKGTVENLASSIHDPDENNPESDHYKSSVISRFIFQTLQEDGLEGIDRLVIILTDDNEIIGKYDETNLPSSTQSYFCLKNHPGIESLKNTINTGDEDSIYIMIDTFGREILKTLKNES